MNPPFSVLVAEGLCIPVEFCGSGIRAFVTGENRDSVPAHVFVVCHSWDRMRCEMDVVRSAAGGDRWFPPLDAAAEALQDLYRALDPAEHIEKYLRRLCEHAVELIEDADMAGVTVLDEEGTPSTAARTSREVAMVDELQYRSWEGPCVEAAESAEIVVADRVAASQRWPGLSSEARRFGVESFLSIPLPPLEPGVRAGAVNVYGSRADGFARSEVALMNLFTTAAGYAIGSTERYRGARQLASQLERALESRAVIDQAKGVLMAVHGVDADAAFAMLVDKSQRTNTKLWTVAEDLLASVRTVET